MRMAGGWLDWSFGVTLEQTAVSFETEKGRWLKNLLAVGLILFLVMLPFHLVIKKLAPDPAGTYWKEILLGILALIWGIWSLLNRRVMLTNTPLDRAILLYAGLLIVRALIDRNGMVTAWGLYISILYLPLVWLATFLLRGSPAWLTRLAWFLAAVGAVVSLGGLLEFVLNRTLWPSLEAVERQGFADVYVYGTQLRRVYFVFDSPTTLANTLAMLLPVALSLMMATNRAWKRALAGLAAILLAACVVVTFSRGIWVAAAIALVFMAVQVGFIQRNRRAMLIGIGVVVIALATWGGAMAPRLFEPSTEEKGILELPIRQYREMPVISEAYGLEKMTPVEGQMEMQDWVIMDPIEGFVDTRPVIYMHPPETGQRYVAYRVTVPENAALRFGIALAPQVWDPEKGDGVNFSVYIIPVSQSEGEFVFTRYLNPKTNLSDRRWRNYVVDLSLWAGQEINVMLITENGPQENWAYDWAGWSGVQVVQINPTVLASYNQQKPSVFLQHLQSIWDWTRDETNRDRLAAWNQSFSAWQRNPLWGVGLGSTGVAALRTNPENAFVTESQVLKAMTELGIPGLVVWVYLWFEIARTALRAFRAVLNDSQRAILLGLSAALLVVFIESMVYQNLEVKQVNAYFWTFTGMLAFLAASRAEKPARVVEESVQESIPVEAAEAPAEALLEGMGEMAVEEAAGEEAVVAAGHDSAGETVETAAVTPIEEVAEEDAPGHLAGDQMKEPAETLAEDPAGKVSENPDE